MNQTNEISISVRDEAFGLSLDGHKTQDEKILAEIISFNSEMIYPSAHDIQNRLPGMLITSIRRSLTNMCNEGLIEAVGKRKYTVNGLSVPSTTYRVVEQGVLNFKN